MSTPQAFDANFGGRAPVRSRRVRRGDPAKPNFVSEGRSASTPRSGRGQFLESVSGPRICQQRQFWVCSSCCRGREHGPDAKFSVLRKLAIRRPRPGPRLSDDRARAAFARNFQGRALPKIGVSGIRFRRGDVELGRLMSEIRGAGGWPVTKAARAAGAGKRLSNGRGRKVRDFFGAARGAGHSTIFSGVRCRPPTEPSHGICRGMSKYSLKYKLRKKLDNLSRGGYSLPRRGGCPL